MIYRKPQQNKVAAIPSARLWLSARRFGAAGLVFVAAAWWLDSHGGSPPSQPEMQGPAAVERVVDGDTLRLVLDNGDRRTLRLQGVDAPESGQGGGVEAREFLAGRVCGREVSWYDRGQDRFGRTVARVEVAGEDLGVLLLRNGMAWRVRRYLEHEPTDVRDAYEKAWREARAAGVGLWAGEPQPPWEWRRTNRPASGHSISCAGRR